eukprot:COSAG06_NODE_22386_length_725_cov_0.968051_1_plen_40_part_10
MRRMTITKKDKAIAEHAAAIVAKDLELQSLRAQLPKKRGC